MKFMLLGLSLGLISSLLASCAPSEPNVLDELGTVDITIKGQLFRLWIADDSNEQQRGLMFITAEQMVPYNDGAERGMLFKFDREREMSFWMKNTIIPLDIVYLDANGVALSLYTMAPLDTSANRYPSLGPAQFAIEVNADVFSDLGLQPGDLIEIP